MMSDQTKTITLASGGTITVVMRIDLLQLSTADRDFVFRLIDHIRAYEPEATAEPAKTVAEIPVRCADCGGPRSPTSASLCSDCWTKKVAENARKREQRKAEVAERKRLREERNKDRQSVVTEASGVSIGQRFGSLIVEEIKKERGSANRPYFVRCLCDCGGTRTLSIQYLATAFEDGDQLACVECDRKQSGQKPVEESQIQFAAELIESGATVKSAAETIGVHRNTINNRLKAIAAEARKRAEEVRPAEKEATPVELPESPSDVDESEQVRTLARKLFEQHLAQCRKMKVTPDASFAEFLNNAREIIKWEKQNPGSEYVQRYTGKVPTDDFVTTSYNQYSATRA